MDVCDFLERKMTEQNVKVLEGVEGRLFVDFVKIVAYFEDLNVMLCVA